MPSNPLEDTPAAIGWKFVSWTRPPRPCNVGPCTKMVTSGYVSVRAMHPENGDPVVCTDCHFKIMLGVDPGGDPLPEWEVKRREATNPDR